MRVAGLFDASAALTLLLTKGPERRGPRPELGRCTQTSRPQYPPEYNCALTLNNIAIALHLRLKMLNRRPCVIPRIRFNILQDIPNPCFLGHSADVFCSFTWCQLFSYTETS